MILQKIMDAKAPCGTHRSGAVEVVSISDFDFAEPFGSAFFLPKTSFRARPGISLEVFN